MKKKIIILCDYSHVDQKEIILNLKKNFFKIFFFKNYTKKKFNIRLNDQKLKSLKTLYKKKGIELDAQKINEINLLLKKIKAKYSNQKIFISFLKFNNITQEGCIFYELSKSYKMYFVKPERCLIKNRYILAKNIYMHPYELNKKIKISKKKFNSFKKIYAKSLVPFSLNVKKKIGHVQKQSFFLSLLQKMMSQLCSFFIKSKFNTISNNFILLILGNSKKLNDISIINLRSFITKMLKKFSYQIVVLIHPNTDLSKFVIKCITSSNYFLNKKITLMHKPSNLKDIVKNSKFIIHTSSSFSPQLLFFDKQILCIAKNIPYLNSFNNLIINFKKNNFNFNEKIINKKDIIIKDQFLKNLLSNSVNYKGESKVSLNIKDYYQNWNAQNNAKYYKYYNELRKKTIFKLLNKI
jgi:hypothetical protein